MALPFAWPFGARMSVLIGVLVLLGFGITPGRLTNRIIFLLYHSPGLLFSSMRVPPPAPTSLKAAVLNVTADFNELVYIMQDFLRSPGVEPGMDNAFRQYLAQRAVRSHPVLENTFDWILAIYKFAFPFLVISLVAKIGSGGGGGGEDTDTSRQATRSEAAAGQGTDIMGQRGVSSGAPASTGQSSWGMEQLLPPSSRALTVSGSSRGKHGDVRHRASSPLGPATPQERVARTEQTSSVLSSENKMQGGVAVHARAH